MTKIYTYFPSLRAKAGEAKAISELSPDLKSRICPILELPDKLSSTFDNLFPKEWANRFAILDGNFNTDYNKNSNDFLSTLSILSKNNISVAPCYVMSGNSIYNNYVLRIYRDRKGYIAIKVDQDNIKNIKSFMVSNGIDYKKSIIILNLKDISKEDSSSLSRNVENYLRHIVSLGDWRCIVLLSGSAPRDHSHLMRGKNIIPRLDWALWRHISSIIPQIQYGDYVTSHFDLTPPPVYVLTSATVSARYTADEEWIIYKGFQVKGPNGIKMGLQYIGHANSLMGETKYKSLVASWGDYDIARVASIPISKTKGAGGRKEWTAISVNRHISVVLSQLP